MRSKENMKKALCIISHRLLDKYIFNLFARDKSTSIDILG